MPTSRAMGRITVLAALPIALAAAAPPPRHQITDDWPSLASSEDGECALEIIGNGKFMQLRASGLEPGAAAHLHITNTAMKPIDWQVRADAKGRWSQLYIPFLWSGGDGTVRNRPRGGSVAVTLAAATCTMSASAPWRSEIRVIR